jgi:type IV pilus assembly protein PilY1
MTITYLRPLRPASLGVTLLLSVLGGLTAPAFAKTVDLDPEPPDLHTSVAPNILITFDDSRSMSRAYMPDDVGTGSRFDSTTTGNGTIHSARYYYSGVNTVYFDPNETYLPPLMPDGVTRFPNASYTSAWRDGICANVPADGSLGTRCNPINRVNLNTSFFQGFDTYHCIDTASPCNSDDAGSTSNALSTRNIPASVRMIGSAAITGGFYYVAGSGGTLLLQQVTTAQQQNFANWYSYYRTRSLMARSGIASAFATLDGTIRVAWQNLELNPITDSTRITAFSGTQRAAFFRWVYTMQVGAGTENRIALERAGKFFSSGYANGLALGANGATNPYWEPIASAAGGGLELSCRQNFHMLVTDGYWNGAAPGAVDAARLVSSNFKLPDGTVYGNLDGTNNAAHVRAYRGETRPAGAASPSLADQAFHFWNRDLRPGTATSSPRGLANNVPANIVDTRIGVTNTASRPVPSNPQDDAEIYFNPANDPATWQHVVQHTVGLGVSGTLPAATTAQSSTTLRDLRTGARTWPVPLTAAEDATKIDDTWHAAINGRGTFFTARKPQDLIDGIRNVLNSVASNRQGGSSVATTSSVLLTADGEGYGTEYSTSGWAGRVYKRRVNAAGVVAVAPTPPLWEAGALLNTQGPANRRLFTSDTNNRRNGLPFVYASLSTAQRAVLDRNPEVLLGSQTLRENPLYWLPDARGAQRVAYLRGDRSAETAAPNFRTRTSLLGAIIDSQPLYVSVPGGLGDSRSSYEDYVVANRARRPMLYVGSNDGVLHAFNANSGSEEWGFIPGTLIENGRMTRMTLASGKLVPGADDSPVSSDVMIDGDWKTVLVGSLRLGGRGVYALDITSPAAASQNAAAGKLLWEFNNDSANAANLGYSYGSANIVRLNTGDPDDEDGDQWAVVVSSGYFPDEGLDSNDPAAAENRTSLFVLNIKDGSIIKELRTPAGVTSYGLSTPAAYDSDSSGTTDVVMAGDLAGNLWRFDLSSANPNEWGIRQFFTTYTVAADIGKQPITVMPVAFTDGQHPIWVFGTGKYLGETDRSTTIPVQSFYGVRDSGAAGLTYPLQPGQLTAQTITDNGSARTITRNPVGPQNHGWKMALNQRAGERNVATLTPLYVSNIAVLLTLVPGGGDPCNTSRFGVVMVVDAASGGALPDVAFSGRLVSNPPPRLPVSAPVGGGPLVIPGVSNPPLGSDGSCANPPCGELPLIPGRYWHREGWREILSDYQP